jgi:hypothetical protein
MNWLRARLLGKELKRPRSVSRQTQCDIMSAHSVEEYHCRSIFMPFGDHIISQIIDRFIKHKDSSQDVKEIFVLLGCYAV